MKPAMATAIRNSRMVQISPSRWGDFAGSYAPGIDLDQGRGEIFYDGMRLGQ